MHYIDPETARWVAHPADTSGLIAVSDSDYLSAMSRAPGETLSITDGRLVIIPAPPPTIEQLMAGQWSAWQASVAAVFNGSRWLGIGEVYACANDVMNPYHDEAVRLKAWLADGDKVINVDYGADAMAAKEKSKAGLPSLADMIAALPKYQGA